MIFPAVIRLRYTHPNVPRPYRIPLGNTGAWLGGAITLGWIILGSWIAVFPDTIENLVGAGYNFKAYWGISRLRFEVFTLGTLLVIAIIGIVGYVIGSATRSTPAEIPLDGTQEPSAAT